MISIEEKRSITETFSLHELFGYDSRRIEVAAVPNFCGEL